MPISNNPWGEEEKRELVKLKAQGRSYTEIADILGRTRDSVRNKFRDIRPGNLTRTLITESPYPRYDEPLVMEGNALILPDLEFPFHHAEFLNRVLELADAWNIRQCIVAGDILHFDSISAWEANWINEGVGGLSDNDERKFLDFANDLSEDKRQELIELVVEIGQRQEDGGPSVSQELRVARKSVKALSEIFDRIDFVIGNHDGRLLRALGSPMFPSEILRLIEAGNIWRIAPYYFSRLISGGELYQIEHPVNAAKNSPYKLASKYQCHILQAHAHRWGMDTDISGKFYAIHMGCIVDEARLPYAAQRHFSGDAHILGAVIVVDGYPYLLSEHTPWERFKKMK